MHQLIAQNLAELNRLCVNNRVRRLELFGSAATNDYDQISSDLDFLVEFENLEPEPTLTPTSNFWTR